MPHSLNIIPFLPQHISLHARSMRVCPALWASALQMEIDVGWIRLALPFFHVLPRVFVAINLLYFPSFPPRVQLV
jgi:hypothetical protein